MNVRCLDWVHPGNLMTVASLVAEVRERKSGSLSLPSSSLGSIVDPSQHFSHIVLLGETVSFKNSPSV